MTSDTIRKSDESRAVDHGEAAPGYRLPGSTHVGRVRLQIADLSRSMAYYESILGLRMLGRSAASAVLGAHGDDRPLVELHERRGAQPVPRRGRLGLYHFALLLPDRPALGRFVGHLEAIGAYAGMSDHDVSEAIYLTDPDGLGIEVYADRPRSAWRFHERQLQMTTMPLDVGSLLRAGNGEPWKGMPVGTVMGHVHLHVGKLGEAESFYHKALGLDKVVWSYPGALFLSAGGYHHHLGTNTWATGAEPAGDGDARLLEWELVVPTAADAAAAGGSLAAAGFTASESPEGWRAVDPWGTALLIRNAVGG